MIDADMDIRKMPTFLADHVEKNNLQGKLRYDLFVGASSGAETENRWAGLDMINRRTPHQVGKQIAKGINEGRIKFFDKHLSMFPNDLVYVSYIDERGIASSIRSHTFRDSTPRTDPRTN
jgi:acetyl-CoA hydrolase